MKKKVTKTETSCDYCGAVHGDKVSEGDGGMMGSERSSVRIVTVKHLKCGHDICDYCWWYPGDMGHCPKCGSNRIGCVGHAKRMTKRDYCFKHNVIRQSDGSCPSCRTVHTQIRCKIASPTLWDFYITKKSI